MKRSIRLPKTLPYNCIMDAQGMLFLYVACHDLTCQKLFDCFGIAIAMVDLTTLEQYLCGGHVANKLKAKRRPVQKVYIATGYPQLIPP